MALIPINKLAEVLGAEVEETVRAVKVELFNGVIEDTRVDTGRLRGSWITSTGSPSSESPNRLDPSGSQAKGEVAATVKPDTIDYLTSNLEYAEIWEERDGMVARQVARIERIVKEQTRGR